MKINERNKMTFPQLWKDLRQTEMRDVRREIQEGLRKDRATFWRWYKGDKTPSSFAEKQMFANIINRVLGIQTTPDTLFPKQ